MKDIDLSALQALAPQDIDALERIVALVQSRNAIGQASKKGQKKEAIFEVDEGILDALSAHCAAEGINRDQLIEDLLVGHIGTIAPSVLERRFLELTRTMWVA